MAENVMKPLGQSLISKVGFWQGLIVGAIAIITSLATFFIVAGGSLQRLNQVEKETDALRLGTAEDRRDLQKNLKDIQDRMVDKDDFRELKQDVKDLIKQKR